MSLTEHANLIATRLWQPQQYANVYGKCDARFLKLKDAFARIQPANLDKADGIGGSALTVFYDGNPVVDLYTGSMDNLGCELIPWQADTMALSFSCGKGVLATLVQVLVSEGVLSYDVPIAHYWKAFAQNGKENITLRHVLCHECGLFNIKDITSAATDVLDWELMLSRVEVMKPMYATSHKVTYKAVTFGWIVGGVIEKATKKPLAKVLTDKLLAPLGIENDLYFGVPTDQLYRVARVKSSKYKLPNANDNAPSKQTGATKKPSPLTTVIEQAMKTHNRVRGIDSSYYFKSIAAKGMDATFDFWHDDVLQACIPAFNGVFTARAVATMYAMLANGGTWQGKPLIKPDVFATATRLQNDEIDNVFLSSMKWRLGYHKLLTLGKPALDAFGHSGYNATMAWCDPLRKLAVSYTHNFKGVLLGTDFRLHYLNQKVIKLADTL